MKKFLALTLSLAMMVSMLAACGNDTTSDTNTGSENTTSSSGTASSSGSADSTNTSGDADTTEPDLSGEPDGVVPGTSATFYATNTNAPASQLPGYGGSVNIIYILIYDTLFWSPSARYDDLDGLLVDTWTISDDGLTWVLNLHENVTFNNGNPLNAESVISSLDYYIVEKYDTFTFSAVETYEATGEFQVTIQMSSPDPEFMFKTCNHNVGIFDTGLYEEMGRVVEAAYMAGSGPYYVSDYAIGDSLTLTAREDHWCEERQAHIETLTCKCITNANTQYNSLAAGEVDYGCVTSYDTMEMLQANDIGTVIDAPGTLTTVWMNADGMCEYLANERVREALSLLLNQDELVIAATGGYGTVGQNAINSGLSYSHDRIYDPDAALAILAEEGVDPSTIELTAITTASYSELFSNMQAQLMEFGITLNFVIQESPAVITAGAAGEWDLWAELGGVNNLPYYSKLSNILNTTGSQYMIHDDAIAADVDSIVTESLLELDTTVRNDLLNDALQLLDEHYAYLLNYTSLTWAYANNRIANVNVDWWNAPLNWRAWESWIVE